MNNERIKLKQNRCNARLRLESNQASSGALTKGFTLVEVIIALGVLAIVVAFAVSPLERMSARTDVDLARENIVHALGAARGASIRTNTPVRIVISADSGKNRQAIFTCDADLAAYAHWLAEGAERFGVVDNPTGEEQYIFITGTTNRGGKYVLEWTCGGSGLEAEFLPEKCRG